MPLMLGALYDALKSGNIPEDKAARAAEEVAAYDNKLSNIEADVRLLKWAVGILIPLTIGLYFK